MIEIVCYIMVAIFLIALVLIYIEIKKAPLVDSSVPFLHDDYDENGDPTRKYINVFCKHCAKSLDEYYCKNGKNSMMIGDAAVEKCKKESLFEPK